MFRRALIAALACALPATAFADERPPATEQPVVEEERTGPLPVIAAVVPGFVVHGSGSFVRRDRTTAKRLLAMEGIGLGIAAVGGVPVALTGANPWASGIGAPLVVAGVGMFMQSWIADIYRAAGGGEGVPLSHAPFSLEAGVAWTHDAYRDRSLLFASGQAILHPRVELVANARRSYDAQYVDGDLQTRVRILQPHTDVIADGSYLEVRATGRIRDDSDDRVQVATMEAEVAGRLDMRFIASHLRGSYVEMAGGYGGQRAAYASASQWTSLLLGRFAWGMYLGPRGELNLFYDHRRDSIAGGIAAWRAAGFVGSLGARLDLRRLRGPWGVHAELEYGSALVSTIGIRYEGGSK